MGHCIGVYLINKSEFRNDKIDSVTKSDSSDDNIKWTELDENILATTEIPNVRKFGNNKTIAFITTDYFGGPGVQTAKVFQNNKKVLDQDDEGDWKLKPINSALKLLGVTKKSGMDEFDTIGLSKYRNNHNFK
jgi:hypothetical protein